MCACAYVKEMHESLFFLLIGIVRKRMILFCSDDKTMNEHDMGWHKNKVTVKCNLPQSKNIHKHQNKYKIVLKKMRANQTEFNGKNDRTSY